MEKRQIKFNLAYVAIAALGVLLVQDAIMRSRQVATGSRMVSAGRRRTSSPSERSRTAPPSVRRTRAPVAVHRASASACGKPKRLPAPAGGD